MVMKGNSDKMNNILKKYVKLPYKNIDEDVSNFLLNDLLNNSNNYSDEEIKNIIKSFCYNLVSKYYHDFDIEVLLSKEIDSKSTLNNVEGLVLNKTIYLEESVLLDIKNSNIEILRIIFHEIQHIKQRHLLETNNISYKAFLLIMEQIIIMEMPSKYYSDNYLYFFEEVDARLESEFQLYDFLDSNNQELLSDNIDEILENISDCEKQAENMFRKVSDKKVNKEELFDKIIQKNTEYIELYPLLNFYYNSDGSKIPISSIIKRRNSVASNSSDEIIYDRVKTLDKHIILNRSGSKNNIKRDIQSLINYIPSDDIEFNMMELSLNKLITHINENYEDNIINDIYDTLVEKVEYFKNKINETKQTANMYTLKLYIMMQQASYRKKEIK